MTIFRTNKSRQDSERLAVEAEEAEHWLGQHSRPLNIQNIYLELRDLNQNINFLRAELAGFNTSNNEQLKAWAKLNAEKLAKEQKRKAEIEGRVKL